MSSRLARLALIQKAGPRRDRSRYNIVTMSDVINVLLCTDDNYWQHVGATVASLIACTPDCSFRVIVCSAIANPVAEEALRSITPQIEFVRYSPPDISLPATGGHLTLTTYTRMFMTEFLDPAIDKILYLDCDVIVCRNVKPLWETDISDAPLAAVPEPYAIPELFRTRPNSLYYNAGVLLVNLKAWREQRALELLLTFIEANAPALLAFDQDALNGVFGPRIKALNYSWNFHTPYADLTAHDLKLSRAEMSGLRRSPGIVHYVGPNKPWLQKGLTHYRSRYWEALARTPWKQNPPAVPLPALIKERFNWYFPQLAATLRRASGKPSRLGINRDVTVTLVD